MTLAETAGTHAVRIRADRFDPHVTEVAPGTSVTWTNEDDREHTISSAEMESGDIRPGRSFSHTFDRPGHYRYFCMIHPHIVGEVYVR